MRHAIAATAAVLTVGPVMAENRIDTIRPDAPALSAYGDHVVGVRKYELTNLGQIDIVNTTAENAPTYDRPLTVEVWYPAAESVEAGGTYEGVNLRAASVQVALEGQAVRDAAPASEGSFPADRDLARLSRQPLFDGAFGGKPRVQRLCYGFN